MMACVQSLPHPESLSHQPKDFFGPLKRELGSWPNRAAEEVRGEIDEGARGSSVSLNTQFLSPLVSFPWAPGRAAFCFPQIHSPCWGHIVHSETHPPHCEDSSVLSFQSWVVFEPDYQGKWSRLWPIHTIVCLVLCLSRLSAVKCSFPSF